MITRFAPAPTGYLHVGHVVNALYVWGLSRAAGGRVLLRIEDHDRQRSRPEYERAILEDLEWLGFTADEVCPRQSERGAIYQEALDRLRARQLVYACACARSQFVGAYPGTCADKGLPERLDLGIRVRLAPSVETWRDLRCGPQEQRPHEQCGDLLVRDRFGNWTYQFAVVVDDLLQRVTHVIRGEDLLPSTGRQMQLARLLGRDEPPLFFHHPLIMKDAAHKLSKSDRDTGVRDLRAAGWTAERVIGHAAALAGLNPEGRPLRAGQAAEVVSW